MKLGVHNPKGRAEVIECLHYLMISDQIDETKRGAYKIKREINIIQVFLTLIPVVLAM